VTTSVIFVGSSVANTPIVSRIQAALSSSYGTCFAHCLSKDISSDSFNLSYGNKSKSLRLPKFFLGLLVLFLNLVKTRPRLCYAINPIAGLVVMIYSLMFNTKYIYESLEIFAGTHDSLFSKHKKIFYLIEKLIIDRSNQYIVTDEFRAKFGRRYYRLHKNKIDYIYNTNTFLPGSHDKRERISFSYCGVLIPGRGLEVILRAFSKFSQEVCAESNLIVAGSYHSNLYFATLVDLSRELSIMDSVQFTGRVTSEQIRQTIAESHATFAFYSRSCLNNRLCSPNKYFDAIGVGTYLICNQSPLSKMLISKLSCGYLVQDIDVDQVFYAMRDTFYKHSVVEPVSSRLRMDYSWEEQERKLLALVTRVIGLRDGDLSA
jgi:glycosyltransferase involved in cell wall biosynthesis